VSDGWLPAYGKRRERRGIEEKEEERKAHAG
jgi:hypothetical protein